MPAKKAVAGWFNDGWELDSLLRFQDEEIFNEANPYWYNVGTSDGPTGNTVADGSIYTRHVADMYGNHEIQSTALLIPTIGDSRSTLRYGQVGSILRSDTLRKQFIDNIFDIVIKNNYDGIDLNFENLVDCSTKFILFLDELCTKLHAFSKIVSVTLKPMRNMDEESASCFALSALKESAVDRFKIMLYDHNYDHPDGVNVPTGVAPIQWCRDVLNYVIRERGLPHEKIQIGLHNYAHVWRRTREQRYTKMRGFCSYEDLRKIFEVDEALDVPVLHDFLFEEDFVDNGAYKAYWGSPKTIAQRVKLVEEYDLLGVTFWVLGREHPQSYNAVRELLHIYNDAESQESIGTASLEWAQGVDTASVVSGSIAHTSPGFNVTVEGTTITFQYNGMTHSIKMN